jgi:hypothetical protein
MVTVRLTFVGVLLSCHFRLASRWMIRFRHTGWTMPVIAVCLTGFVATAITIGRLRCWRSGRLGNTRGAMPVVSMWFTFTRARTL